LPVQIHQPLFERAGESEIVVDLEELIANAVEIADREAKILISTNCETLNEPGLERMARYALKLSRRTGADSG